MGKACLLGVLFVAVLAARLEAAENPAPSYEGVYALWGARVLRLEKERFEIFYDNRFTGRTKVSGRVSGFGVMSLSYFNGTAEVQSRATWGIVEGHLWVGVMRVNVAGEWRSEAENAGIFYGQENLIADATIRWDMGRGTCALEIPRSGRPGVALGGVTAVPAGAERFGKDSKRFLAVARHDGGEPRTREIQQWFAASGGSSAINLPGSGLAQGTLGVYNNSPGDTSSMYMSRSVIALPGGWSLGAARADAERVIGTEDLVKAAAKRAGDWGIPAMYEQVGDVLVTPWSLDLGPAGLMAAQVKGEEIRGDWIGAGEKQITIDETDKPADYSRLKGIPVGTSTVTAEVEKMIGHLPLTPEEGGIRMQTYGWDHMMGHGDNPGTIYWFVTGEGKLVRIIFPANCDGGNRGKSSVIEQFGKKR